MNRSGVSWFRHNHSLFIDTAYVLGNILLDSMAIRRSMCLSYLQTEYLVRRRFQTLGINILAYIRRRGPKILPGVNVLDGSASMANDLLMQDNDVHTWKPLLTCIYRNQSGIPWYPVGVPKMKAWRSIYLYHMPRTVIDALWLSSLPRYSVSLQRLYVVFTTYCDCSCIAKKDEK